MGSVENLPRAHRFVLLLLSLDRHREVHANYCAIALTIPVGAGAIPEPPPLNERQQQSHLVFLNN